MRLLQIKLGSQLDSTNKISHETLSPENMSIQLLNKLNGNNSGLFASFLSEHKGTDINIAWYPSANMDFRPLLYFNRKYTQQEIPELQKQEIPDIFIYTDYMPWDNAHMFLNNPNIFSDGRTTVSLVEHEWLPNLKVSDSFNTIEWALGHFQGNPNLLNRVIYMKLRVDSERLGTYFVPLIYVFTFNEYFFTALLRPCKSKISHVIHVRYGGGMGGGGTASGAWLPHILSFLKVKIFITDNHLQYQSGDKFLLKEILRDKFRGRKWGVKLQPLKVIDGRQWSNHGDVTLYRVSSQNLIMRLQEMSRRFEDTEWANANDGVFAIIFAKAYNFLVKSPYNNFEWAVIQLEILMSPGNMSVESEIEAIESGCEQILSGCGFTPELPITGLGVASFYNLLRLFGFESVTRNTRYINVNNQRGAMDSILFRNQLEGRQITMYNFCRFDNNV
jgi:hypothetical protein